jgi:diguanylate cyclase
MSLSKLANLVLGSDAHQRIRLMQTAIASGLMGISVLGVNYVVWVGLAPPGPAAWYSAFTLVSFAGFFVFIRLGFNRIYLDPSLALAQIVIALMSGVWAYAITGPGRGAVFATPIVAMMFGMYSLEPRTVRQLGWLGVSMFGGVMFVMSRVQPQVYDPKVEFLHFFVLAAMLLATSLLSGQMARLRHRLRTQKAELAQALERIQDLATHDELTGLFNRRHMQNLLQLEHQRCMRSGHPFCIAMLDLDHFKRVNDTHGHAAGDAVLRAFADEARAAIRGSDTIARWGGEEFLLLMTDTRASLGRQGVERLRERIQALRPVSADGTLGVTLSAGLAEHRAGEPVGDTISRADRALYLAKAQGRNRVVIA